MIMLCDRQKRAGCEGRCRQTWRRSSIMRRATGPSSRQRGHWSWQQQEDLRNLGKRQTAKNVTRSQRCIIREDLFVWTSIQEHGNKACARMSRLDLRVSDMQRKHNEVTAVVSQLKNCLIDSRLEHRGFTKHGNQCMIILSSLVKDLPLDLQYSSNYKRFFSIQSEPSLDFAVQINFVDTTTPLSDLRYTLYFLIS